MAAIIDCTKHSYFMKSQGKEPYTFIPPTAGKVDVGRYHPASDAYCQPDLRAVEIKEQDHLHVEW